MNQESKNPAPLERKYGATTVASIIDETSTALSTTAANFGVHVVAASGNQIIAVANPALALAGSGSIMEPITIKRETQTPDLM